MHDMLDMLGQRQQRLLQHLLQSEAGLTVDELTRELDITHNAVRQHLTALERDGLVERGATRPTGRRPEQAYVLSARGRELFPRQYTWFGDLLIESLRASEGSSGLSRHMRTLGTRVGEQMRGEADPAAPADELVAKLADAMHGLGYESTTERSGETGPPNIVARNCVFHHLAAKYPEVCQFDLGLMGAATGSDVQHLECMVRGGHVCRFRFRKPG